MDFEDLKERILNKKILIIGVILILTIIICFITFNNNNKETKEETLVSNLNNLEKEELKTTEDKCIVDIKGYVNNSGLYEIDCSKRINDAINLAGGLKEDADTSIINLGKKVKDEMVIIIYSKDEVNNFTKVKETEEKVIERCKNSSGVANDACINKEDRIETNIKVSDDSNQVNTSKKLISINNATKEELMTLTGIGESKAQAIITYREEHGPFMAIEDLKNISGIGDKMLDKIKEDITL